MVDTYITSLGIKCFITTTHIYIQQEYKDQITDDITILELVTLIRTKYYKHRIEYLINSKYMKKYKDFNFMYLDLLIIKRILVHEINVENDNKRVFKELCSMIVISVIVFTIILFI